MLAGSLSHASRQTTTSSPLLNRESVFITMESPTKILDFLLMPSIAAAEYFFLYLVTSPLQSLGGTVLRFRASIQCNVFSPIAQNRGTFRDLARHLVKKERSHQKREV